jgi:hypothetical protein
VDGTEQRSTQEDSMTGEIKSAALAALLALALLGVAGGAALAGDPKSGTQIGFER